MRTASLLLFVGASLVGCGASTPTRTPTPVPNFVPNDPVANASNLAKLVEQLCIENGHDRKRFAEAIRATGWDFERTQTLDPDNPYSVDVWKSPEAQVIHGKLSGDEILVCNVAVAQKVTDTDRLSRAIAALAQSAGKDGEWRWRRGSDEFVMALGEGSERSTAISVNVEIWRLPWWRRLLG